MDDREVGMEGEGAVGYRDDVNYVVNCEVTESGLSGWDQAPVMITIPVKRLEDLKACLKECAEDLKAELHARYDNTLGNPTQARRYARDMEPVNRASELLNSKFGTW